jgi:DNA invertase Pin-like site-specific DNA recombinase
MLRKGKAKAAENHAGNGHAVAYLRTSSATNVGGDSGERQRAAIRQYASRAGISVGAEFHDAAVSGADPLDQRAGFVRLLAWCRENDVRTILVENASRFARDLIVQETGHAMLCREGFALVAVDDPDAFTADTPTARMVRQILGAVSEFEKAALVAKLRGARDRASATVGRRVEGRKGHAETNPEMTAQARRLARKNPRTGKARSLREIAAELVEMGFTTASGKAFSASQVQRLLTQTRRGTAA